MGSYRSVILNHSLSVGDYVFDYVKKSQPKQYYANYKIDATYSDDMGIEKSIKIPLSHFGKIKKNRLYYRFEVGYKKDWLTEFLFNLLKKNKVDLACYIFYAIYSRDYTKYIFLTTSMKNDNMSFSNTTKQIYILKTFAELEWIIKQELIISKNA